MPLQQIPCTYLCAKTPSLLGDLGAHLLTSFHAESSSFAFMKKNDEGRMRMWSPLHTLKESSREREMEGEGGQSYLKHSYYLVLYPHDARCILYDIFWSPSSLGAFDSRINFWSFVCLKKVNTLVAHICYVCRRIFKEFLSHHTAYQPRNRITVRFFPYVVP